LVQNQEKPFDILAEGLSRSVVATGFELPPANRSFCSTVRDKFYGHKNVGNQRPVNSSRLSKCREIVETEGSRRPVRLFAPPIVRDLARLGATHRRVKAVAAPANSKNPDSRSTYENRRPTRKAAQSTTARCSAGVHINHHALTTTSPRGPRNRISRRFRTSRPRMRSLPTKSACSRQG